MTVLGARTAVLAFALAWSAPVLAQPSNFAPLDPAWLVDPNPRVQAYYSQQADDIRGLQRVSEDQNSSVEQRQKAFTELAFKFNDAALPTAAKLVKDPSIDIARQALEVLSNSVGMGSHDDHSPGLVTVGHPSESPRSEYLKAQHAFSRQALRSALEDSRVELRSDAVRALIPLSDEAAINSVREAAKNGEIPDSRAVQLCGQATSDLARSCVLGYLDSGSADAKNAAIYVLGALPSYRPMVRNKIFFNASADPKIRAAAAGVLSRYDTSFMNYGLTITADPKTPPEVYASTLEGYARSAAALGKLDSVQRFAIDKAVTNYRALLQSDPSKNAEYLKSLDATTKALAVIQ